MLHTFLGQMRPNNSLEKSKSIGQIVMKFGMRVLDINIYIKQRFFAHHRYWITTYSEYMII